MDSKGRDIEHGKEEIINEHIPFCDFFLIDHHRVFHPLHTHSFLVRDSKRERKKKDGENGTYLSKTKRDKNEEVFIMSCVHFLLWLQLV